MAVRAATLEPSGTGVTVTSVSPTGGSTGGGTRVTVNGTGFVSGAVVRFGSNKGTSVTFVNSTQVKVTSPAGTRGVVGIVVTDPNGSQGVLKNAYTYLPPPSLSSIAPNIGQPSGGNVVTLTGQNFTSGAKVTFGGTPSPSVVFNSASSLTVTVPPGSVGSVKVTETNPDGQFASITNGYTYVQPAITSVSPPSGPAPGGTSVTIAGSGFLSGATVKFNGVASATVNVVSSSQITAVTPADSNPAGGTVPLVVTNPGGLTATSSFIYLAQPTVTGLSPNAGPTAGGTSVTITGTNFLSGATVTFAGTAASATVVSSTQITATSPAGAAGSASVVVTDPGGLTAAGSFTYIAQPSISSLSPASGSVAGGTSVNITGANFAAGSTVTFNGISSPSVTVSSSTLIVAVTPADSNNTGGPSPVVVTVPGNLTATGSFDYVGFQSVTSVNPTSGPAAGGTTVDVYGSGFVPTTQMLFGPNSATGVTLINSTHIQCVNPAGSGVANVSAFTPGSGSGSLPNAFTYIQPLAITSVSPTIGPTAGNNVVTINGTGFVSGATVTFGGGNPLAATFVNADTLTVPAPATGPSTVGVTVTNPDQTNTSLPASYTFTNGPAVWSITPNSGPQFGGQTITISGANLSTVNKVQFGSLNVTIQSTAPGKVLVTQPTRSGAGSVNVVVQNPNGSQTIVNGFTYLSLAIATLALDDGNANMPYSIQLQTNNAGLAPLHWSIAGGTLPPGLTLNPNTGLLSGTPSGPPNATVYQFTVKVTDSSTPVKTSQTQFHINILYGFTTSPIPSTYFGMTLNDYADWPQAPPQGVGVQIGALAKGLSVSWPFIEQVQGVYNWTTLDNYVNQAAAHGVDIFYTNFDFPPWAVPDSSNPDNCGAYASGIIACTNMVSNIADWKNWNTALVTRYSGKIKMFELYNEPNTVGSFTGTVPQMVQLTNTFHDIIRATAAPGTLIGAPSASSAQYIQQYYAAGGTVDVDTVNLHEYPNVTVNDFPEFELTKIEGTKQAMITAGAPSLVSAPLWDTETGWGNNAYALSDPQQRAAFVARHLFIEWSVGVRRTYWYAWDESNWGTLFNEISPGVGETFPAGMAYQQVQTWLLGANMQTPCTANGGTQYGATYTCNLYRPGGYQAQAVWNASLQCSNNICPTTNYTPGSIYIQYRDIAGNVHSITPGQMVPISAQPILLENQTTIP